MIDRASCYIIEPILRKTNASWDLTLRSSSNNVEKPSCWLGKAFSSQQLMVETFLLLKFWILEQHYTSLMSSFAKDSEFSFAHFDGCLIDLVLPEVKRDKLPDEDIPVPELELPPPDQEDENNMESIREKEEKWTDPAYYAIDEILR